MVSRESAKLLASVRLGHRGPYMPNDYSVVRQSRQTKLPESDRKTLNPKYLLNHENHFDPNVYTPEQMLQKQSVKPVTQT